MRKGPLPAKQILIGATLLGVGMAVSGACPGTVSSRSKGNHTCTNRISFLLQVAAQMGAGVSESLFTMIGSLIGGTIFMLSESALDTQNKPDPK